METAIYSYTDISVVMQLFLKKYEMIKNRCRTGKRGKRRYMKYVISDIHGMWDKYQNMLKLINFSAEDELYILGDVIDRGEDGIKILQDIRKHTNMHLLMGIMN